MPGSNAKPRLLLAPLLLASGCSSPPQYTEPPLAQTIRLTPEHARTRLRIAVERRWPGPPGPPSHYQFNDQLSATATLRWIHLGPDPAPSVVELSATGPIEAQKQATAIYPNRDQSAGVYGQFQFEQCQPRCIVELDLAWHHAPAGELEVTWNVQASRSAWKSRGVYRSQNWQFRVVPLDRPAIATD